MKLAKRFLTVVLAALAASDFLTRSAPSSDEPQGPRWI